MDKESARNVLERWYRQPGGIAEVLRIAGPLILTNSFFTTQVALDRMYLSRVGSDAVAAAVPAAALFWTPFILLQHTAGYATTFVAQYLGAGRSKRIGPVVWQAIYFSVFTGLAFLCLVPMAEWVIALGGHEPRLQVLEVRYFRCLCFAALPMLITAATSSFFAGRGDSWTVLKINAVGLVINALLAYVWIFGKLGFPALGIEGAGWATVAGSSAAAIYSLALTFKREYDHLFATRQGWRPEPALLLRFLYYGVPSGMQWALETTALTAFLFLIGRLGETELAASNIAFTVNMIAFFPAVGMGQGVAVLVGQGLGQDRPDLAARSTWTGFALAWTYMTIVSALYVLWPGLFVSLFSVNAAPDEAIALSRLIAVLLRFVAIYSLFDSMNAVFSFALRGAGDTHFVSALTLGLSWPIIVIPTWLVCRWQWGILWPWGFLTVYVACTGLAFLCRFLGGKWRSMRVIEPVLGPLEAEPAA
jgi:MATE family multidrug resistance protein